MFLSILSLDQYSVDIDVGCNKMKYQISISEWVDNEVGNEFFRRIRGESGRKRLVRRRMGLERVEKTHPWPPLSNGKLVSVRPDLISMSHWWWNVIPGIAIRRWKKIEKRLNCNRWWKVMVNSVTLEAKDTIFIIKEYSIKEFNFP